MRKVSQVSQFLPDPAFVRCLFAAAGNVELVTAFDRLNGSNLSFRGSALEREIDLATGRMDSDIAAFVEFVRETIYERLEPQALADLRGYASNG